MNKLRELKNVTMLCCIVLFAFLFLMSSCATRRATTDAQPIDTTEEPDEVREIERPNYKITSEERELLQIFINQGMTVEQATVNVQIMLEAKERNRARERGNSFPY